MNIEDYFDFVSADEIRFRGTRVGIEVVMSEYLAGALPEEIAVNYPPLTLEQVYAAITYYLGHRSTVEAYLDAWRKRSGAGLERQRMADSSLLERLAAARRAGLQA